MVSVPGPSPGINVPPGIIVPLIKTFPLMVEVPPSVPPTILTIAPFVAVRVPFTSVLPPVCV